MAESDEEVDRIAIRRLIDEYAKYADRREPEAQFALYASGGRTVVHRGSQDSEPDVLTTPEEHLAGFRGLSAFEVTTHFNGQTILDLDGDVATAETYCLAHHQFTRDGVRMLTVISIRYEDTFTRTSAGWRFAERVLVITWTDTRESME